MTRYFFHSIDGKIVCDDEGIDCSGPDQAIERATREARILATEGILERGTLSLGEQIRVTDSAGETIAIISVRDAVTIED
jgi:hypothetical protein